MASISGDYSTNLVSYWELEETSGTRYDSHGSNNLTDNNTVGYATGKQGNCADFEAGNSEYLSLASPSTSFKGFGSFSINVWVKWESLPSSPNRMALIWREDTFQWTIKNNGGTYQSWLLLRDATGFMNVTVNISTPSTGTWYMLTIVRDVSTGDVSHYVNGSYINKVNTRTANLRSDDRSLNIGNVGDVAFDGLMDEIGIWSRALTSGEVSAIYNSGNGIPYESASTFTPRISFIM